MKNDIIIQTGMHKGYFLTVALGTFTLVVPFLPALIMSHALPRMLSGFGPVPTYLSSLVSYFLLIITAIIAVVWISAIIAYVKTNIVFRMHSVSFQTGLFFKTEGQLGWDEIETVIVQRGPIGSLLGYGTLILVGKGGTQFPLPFMP